MMMAYQGDYYLEVGNLEAIEEDSEFKIILKRKVNSEVETSEVA